MITMVRDVDLATMEFCVYKNLNRGGWSITTVRGSDNKGLLVAHASELLMFGARAVVKESRRQAIENGGYREVCAWFVGKVQPTDGHDVNRFARVTFRPREHDQFFRDDTGENVYGVDQLFFDGAGNAWIQEVAA